MQTNFEGQPNPNVIAYQQQYNLNPNNQYAFEQQGYQKGFGQQWYQREVYQQPQT